MNMQKLNKEKKLFANILHAVWEAAADRSGACPGEPGHIKYDIIHEYVKLVAKEERVKFELIYGRAAWRDNCEDNKDFIFIDYFN